MKRGAIQKEAVQALIHRIMTEAQTASELYAADRSNKFNQGLAQAYTEVLDNFSVWCEDNEIETDYGNLEETAVKWFG